MTRIILLIAVVVIVAIILLLATPKRSVEANDRRIENYPSWMTQDQKHEAIQDADIAELMAWKKRAEK
jgi:energy-converting hydrogenase Eha subunit H